MTSHGALGWNISKNNSVWKFQRKIHFFPITAKEQLLHVRPDQMLDLNPEFFPWFQDMQKDARSTIQRKVRQIESMDIQNLEANKHVFPKIGQVDQILFIYLAIEM